MMWLGASASSPHSKGGCEGFLGCPSAGTGDVRRWLGSLPLSLVPVCALAGDGGKLMQGRAGLGSRVLRRQAVVKKVWVPGFPLVWTLDGAGLDDLDIRLSTFMRLK